jgi:hypothetical protein
MRIVEQDKKVSVEFVGSSLGLLGRALATGVLSFLIIPAPWMAVWFYRWCVGNIRLSDNSRLSFSGEARQIWLPIMATMALSLAGQFIPFFFILVIPVNCYLGLIVIKWFWRNVIPSSGTKVLFTGRYLQYLGWSALLQILFITIIGWAWAAVGMIRWFFRNIKAGDNVVEFYGNGWNILWRSALFILSCFLIIPIPWTSMWLIKWFMSNISIRKKI